MGTYDTDINLAGIYFTSAEQGEDQNFILDKNQNSLMQPKYISHADVSLNAKAKSYFIHEIFSYLLLDTANMAGIDNKWIRKQQKIYWICAAILGVLFLILLSLLIKAFNFNGKYQDAVSKQLSLIEGASVKVNPKEIAGVLGFANKVNQLPENNINKQLLNRGFFKNLGLSQYSDIKKASYSKQQGLIDENILPMLSNEIDENLRESVETKNYKSVYSNLKAYIMLHEKKYYDKPYIYQWIVVNVLKGIGGDKETLKSLELLLNKKSLIPVRQYDESLVQQARDLLIYTDVAEIVMQDLSNYVNTLDQRNLSTTSFITMGGVSTNNIFRRVSDRTLNDPVNIIFTKFGYQQIFLPFVNKRLSNVYKEEQWVIGNHAQMKSVDEVISDIYRSYSQEYIAAWKTYIQDVKMVQPKSLQHAIAISKQLSEKNSSLAGIIKGISLNTNLVTEAPTAVKSDQNATPAKGIVNEAKKDISTSNPNRNQMIDELKVQGHLENIANNFSQFKNLTQGSQDSTAQLDEIINSINDLYVYLVALELSIQNEDQLMPDVRPLVNYRAQVNRLPDPFRPMLDVFVGKITESSQGYKDSQMADLVRQQDQILQASCKNMISNKYPFNLNSAQDLSIHELGELFGKNGSYLTTLSSNVSVSENHKVPFRVLLENGLSGRENIYREAEHLNMHFFQVGILPKWI